MDTCQGNVVAAEIVRMLPPDESAWDAYVFRHAGGTFFHRAGWARLIEDTLGHRVDYLMARHGERIVGILPLVEVQSRLFGRALVSTGFTVGGGPLADDNAIEGLLVAEAERICDRLGFDRIELRAPMAPREGWLQKSGVYVGFKQELDPDVDANLARVRKEQRRMVRKAVRTGLKASVERDAARFLPLYANSLHRHGTPMLSPDFYRGLFERFGDDCDVLMVDYDGEPVAGFLTFYHGDTVLPYYAGSSPLARKLAAHDLAVFELIRHAVSDKKSIQFDFGRSKAGTGPYDFKRHWGFTPAPITYSFRIADGGTPPEINPLNPKYQRKVDLWRSLPRPVVDYVGPWIARQLG